MLVLCKLPQWLNFALEFAILKIADYKGDPTFSESTLREWIKELADHEQMKFGKIVFDTSHTHPFI